MVKPTDTNSDNMHLINRVVPDQSGKVNQGQEVQKTNVTDDNHHQGSVNVTRRLSFTPVHDVYGRNGQLQSSQINRMPSAPQDASAGTDAQNQSSRLTVISQSDQGSAENVISMADRISDLEENQSLPELMIQKSAYSQALETNDMIEGSLISSMMNF